MSTLLDPVTGPITRKQLQALVSAPLAEAGKINVPMGKRPAAKGAPPVYENEFAPAATAQEVRARRDSAKDKKLGDILTYYAGTTIPFDRIVAHTKLDMVTVIRAMKARGRSI